ncbi:MAG: PQQ-like beta-propeller repeat protein [Bacteroidales bacterium]|nr:PQQ-like beta-propeller repeat protein [Bacteroidales bacterium]
MKKNLIILSFFFVLYSCSDNKEVSQWRGPDRDGKYPQTDLLKEWPDDGPTMLWFFEGLGAGHGSVSIAKDQLFVLGMPDTIGVIYSFDLDGKLLWEKEYGVEWHKNYTGSRSTPTVADGLLYFVSGQGEAFCMDTKTGDVLWNIDMIETFDAPQISWGITESPLLDGDRIILTPGGVEHNVVALDRFTGETIWTSKGNSEPSAYCSPILAQHNDTRLILTMTTESILGIDADNGETYWRIEHKQSNKINANSPVYYDGQVFCASSKADTIHGHVMIQLSEDGKTAEVGWRNQEWFNLIGGIILHEGNVYSSSYKKREWFSIDAATGNLNYVSDKLASSVTLFADGLFYCYGIDGVMALVEADETDFKVISSFDIHLGTDQHWAHPVIHDGRLYMRHGEALMCYDIGAE